MNTSPAVRFKIDCTIRMADYGVTDVEYCVVMGSTEDEDEFYEDVESHIADGWKLKGGVSSAAVGATPTVRLFQAMVKETEMRASEHARKHGASGGSGCNRKTRRHRTGRSRRN
jgi:hypothetical protein